MWKRVVSLAVGCVLGGPVAAAAVSLQPVPWTSAGIELEGPEVRVTCVGQFGGCLEGGASELWVPVDDPQIRIGSGQLELELDLVSEVLGSVWTLGYRNAVLVAPEPSDEDSGEGYGVYLEVPVVAVVDVPADPGAPLTDLVFGIDRANFEGNGSMESGALGSGPFPDTGKVERFLAGDRLVLRAWVRFQTDDDDFSVPTTFGTCGFSPGVDLSDCLTNFTIHQPVASVPEPHLGWLGVAGAVAGGVLRRRREGLR